MNAAPEMAALAQRVEEMSSALALAEARLAAVREWIDHLETWKSDKPGSPIARCARQVRHLVEQTPEDFANASRAREYWAEYDRAWAAS